MKQRKSIFILLTSANWKILYNILKNIFQNGLHQVDTLKVFVPGLPNSDMCFRMDNKEIAEYRLKCWLSKRMVMLLIYLLLTPFLWVQIPSDFSKSEVRHVLSSYNPFLLQETEPHRATSQSKTDR